MGALRVPMPPHASADACPCLPDLRSEDGFDRAANRSRAVRDRDAGTSKRLHLIAGTALAEGLRDLAYRNECQA